MGGVMTLPPSCLDLGRLSLLSGTTAILPGLRDLHTYLRVTLSNPGPTVSLRNTWAGRATCPFSKDRQVFPQHAKGDRLSHLHSP